MAVAGLMALFTLGLTWLAVIAGLSASSVEGASAFSYPLIFLPFLSSAFVPTDTMPAPMRAFADHQPLTPLVDTVRNLLTGQQLGDELWTALVWWVGVFVVGYLLAMTIYRKKIT